MSSRIATFLADRDGSANVDWVFLTAGLVSLALAVAGGFSHASSSIGDTVSETVAARPVSYDW